MIRFNGKEMMFIWSNIWLKLLNRIRTNGKAVWYLQRKAISNPLFQVWIISTSTFPLLWYELEIFSQGACTVLRTVHWGWDSTCGLWFRFIAVVELYNGSLNANKSNSSNTACSEIRLVSSLGLLLHLFVNLTPMPPPWVFPDYLGIMYTFLLPLFSIPSPYTSFNFATTRLLVRLT